MIDEITFGGPFRIAQLRYLNEDGTYFRRSLSPRDDLSDLPADVRAKIEAGWTLDVVDAYASAMARAQEPPPPDPRDVKLAALEARLDKVEADTIAARKLQKD